MLDEIAFLFLGRAFARGHTDDAFAAAALRPEGADGRPLDEPAVSNAYDAALIRDQVLHVDLALVRDELGQAWAGVLLLQVAQLLFNDFKDTGFFCEDVTQILNRDDQVFVFVFDFVAFEARQLVEPEIENLIRLMFAEGISAIEEARFVPNQDANFLDLFPGEFESKQLHPRLIAI